MEMQSRNTDRLPPFDIFLMTIALSLFFFALAILCLSRLVILRRSLSKKGLVQSCFHVVHMS